MSSTDPASSPPPADLLGLVAAAVAQFAGAPGVEAVLQVTARMAGRLAAGPVPAVRLYLRGEPPGQARPAPAADLWDLRAAVPPAAGDDSLPGPALAAAAAAATPQPWSNAATGRGEASWLLLPVAGGTLQGVLALQVAAPPDPVALAPYGLLAGLAAPALELALLRPQVGRGQAEMRLLDTISAVVNSSLSLAAILTQSLAQLAAVIPFDGGSIALINLAQELEIQATFGPADLAARQVRMPVGTGISGWVAAHGEPYLSNDLDNERAVAPAMRWAGTNRTINAYMAVPLIVNGQVIGILQVNSRQKDVFTRRDLALLAEVAERCAGAVERARMFGEMQARTNRLASLAEIARRISAALDLEELFQTCYEQVRKVMPADAFLVAVYDAEAELIRYEFLRDNSQVYPKYVEPLDKGLTSYVIRTGTPLMVGAQTELPTPPVAVGADEAQPQALLMVPLVFEDRILGAISTQSYTAHAYTQDDLNLLATIAHQTAVAIRNAQLYQSERAAQQVKNDFISMISHELRTPLTTIKGAAQVMQRRMIRAFSAGAATDVETRAARERDLHQLAMIVVQAERLNALVDDLLDLSRLQSGQFDFHPAPADLAALVRQAAEATQALSSVHRLRVAAPPALPGVFDALRIEQVLTNLIANAIKYSPAGTVVQVTVDQPDPGLARVQVRDEGAGMAAAEQVHLFDRFYRGAAGQAHPGAGLGLGLYISRQIVEWHGGRIWVASAPGAGSTFSFTLPLGGPPVDDGR